MLGRHVFGLLLLFAISVLSGYGQQAADSGSAFNIEGNVRDNSDQHGVENVRVDLMQSTGVPVNSAFTRTDGAFEFSGVANGQYIVEVNAQNYEPSQQAVEIRNSGRRGVTLLLTKMTNPLNSDVSNAVVSAHQLSVPRKAQDEFDKGMSLLYGKSDYRGAINEFQRAIKYFPTYYEAYALEGAAYQSLGQMPAAETALRKSVELSSERYSDALYLLSALLANSDRYQEAATLARKSVELNSVSWQGHFELARALFGLNQFDEAEKGAIEARDKNPDNPTVYILLANIHIKRRDYTALAGDLDAYVKIAPNGPDADWVRQTQERLRTAVPQHGSDSSHAGDGGKQVHDAQNPPDGAGRSNADEPDSPTLPPLPPPSSSDPRD